MVAIFLIIISILLICFEQYASRKRQKIEKYKEIIYTDLNSKKVDINTAKENSIDSIALGIGSSGMNIMDIYSATEEHSEVLEVLQYRFPEELGSFDSPLEWFNKVESLKDLSSTGAYANAYKGQMAENITMEYMEEKGFTDVGDFESRTHPDNDVFGNWNGEIREISVKNGSVDYIKDAIKEYPNSNIYSINSEAYNKMLESGEIDQYSENGINIFTPGFSEIKLAGECSSSLNGIHEAGDISDNIPPLAFAIFGVKIISNLTQFKKNNQSGYECLINISVDAGRVATGGFFALSGSKIGASLGTMAAPGIGTLLGGGVGVIVGAFAGSSLFNAAKEQIKWGDIIETIEYYGEKYMNGFSDTMKKNMAEKYIDLKRIKGKKISEEKLFREYENILNPYEFNKVTLNSVLVAENCNNLNRALEKSNLALQNTYKELFSTCNMVTKQAIPNKENKTKDFAKKLYGNILVSNEWLFAYENLSIEERNKISKYKKQIEKNPNHPYRLDTDLVKFFDGIFYETYYKTYIKNKNYVRNYGLPIYIISALILILAIFFIL